jgi:hypothetical protein
MLDMLDDYSLHIEKTNNKSILARIYGIFTFKTNYFAPLDVVVMQNTVRRDKKHSMVMTFDLKGSLVNRYSKTDKFFWRKSLNGPRILKDNNWLEMNADS